MPRGPRVVIIGPIGAGTTATGRALATRLGLAFHDTDEAIERAAGRAVGDILVVDGESAFRELERAEVLRCLAEERGVVCIGGGAVLDPDVQRALAGHSVAFLDVRIADAAKRIGLDQARPLLGINPRASWTRMMAARRPVYERVGTVRVDTSGRTPDHVADELARMLDPPRGR
jgi:shikimate kinase